MNKTTETPPVEETPIEEIPETPKPQSAAAMIIEHGTPTILLPSGANQIIKRRALHLVLGFFDMSGATDELRTEFEDLEGEEAEEALAIIMAEKAGDSLWNKLTSNLDDLKAVILPEVCINPQVTTDWNDEDLEDMDCPTIHVSRYGDSDAMAIIVEAMDLDRINEIGLLRKFRQGKSQVTPGISPGMPYIQNPAVPIRPRD